MAGYADEPDGVARLSTWNQIVRQKQKLDVGVSIVEVPDDAGRRPGGQPKP